VRQVRRADGSNRVLLHVSGLRDEHRLQLSRAAAQKVRRTAVLGKAYGRARVYLPRHAAWKNQLGQRC
jgi:hypothetical protein